jgi:hypothetical protein
MLGLDQLEKIITDNHLPAEIKDAGQTWVSVVLTDEQTQISETLVMATSDFVDLILHWREHGCHVRPCLAMTASPEHHSQDDRANVA